MAVPKVGSLWTKKDAIREAGELQCKIPDSDDTKEIQPFCPDALKGRRLSYNRCHRRRAHIHSMSRDLADKNNPSSKKSTYFLKISPFCLLGKKMMVMMKAVVPSI